MTRAGRLPFRNAEMPKVANLVETAGAPARPRKPGTPEELQHYIPYLLNRLVNIWNANQNRDLAPYGINGTVLRALAALDINGTLTVNEIAGYAFVEQSYASRTIDQMVAAGLVARTVSRADSRRRQVSLTEKGRALLDELWPVVARNYEEMIAGLPEEAIRECGESLLKMAANADRPPLGEGRRSQRSTE